MKISPRYIGRLAGAGACPEGARFMVSLGDPKIAHGDHTAFILPLTGPAGTLSPTGGEGRVRGRNRHSHGGAFTLLEVMIAMAIFFIAIFSILELTSRCLRAARGLQQTTLDPASLASSLSVSNKLEEGSLPADLVNSFEHEHPGSRCNGQITLVSSNGLYRVDFEVYPAKSSAPSELSILLYRPESTMGLGGGSLKGKLGGGL